MSEEKSLVPQTDASLTDMKTVLADIGLATLQDASIPAARLETLTGVTSLKFFPTITLTQRQSIKATDAGVKAGSFTFKRSSREEKITELGAKFPALILGIRCKSLYYDQATNTFDNQYVVGKEEPGGKFIEYRDKALNWTGDKLKSPWRNGLEVLLWLPNTMAFGVYFANTPNSVSEVENNICQYVAQAVMFTSEPRKTAKNAWFIPSCIPVTYQEFVEWEKPTKEQFASAMNLFTNPVRGVYAQEGDVPAERAETSGVER